VPAFRNVSTTCALRMALSVGWPRRKPRYGTGLVALQSLSAASAAYFAAANETTLRIGAGVMQNFAHAPIICRRLANFGRKAGALGCPIPEG
jgi:hypothetical protein